jgi:coenzyme F420-reducing hydrogenase delta subunit
LEYVGLEPGRLEVRWIAGAEGAKVAQTVQEMTERIRELGPNQKMRDER